MLSTVRAETVAEARRLYAEGRIAEAIAAFRAAADRLERTDPVAAGAARNNACVLLTNTGALDEALEECRAALRLRQRAAEPGALGKAHNNLGLVLQYLARFDEADEHFRQALEINRRAGDAAGEAINLANLGVSATQAGRYADALHRLGQALDLARAQAGSAWAAEQARVARVNQAVVFERLGAYREALRLYDEVLAESSAMDPRRRAALSVNRGIAYRNLGDPLTALEAFREAERAFEAAGDKAALSNLYLNFGLVHHLNLHDPAAAEPWFRRAMELAARSSDRTEEIQDRNHLGFALIDLERFGEAEALFRGALAEAGEEGPAEGRVAALEGLARVDLARGERDRALGHLERAMREIESVGGGLGRRGLFEGYIRQKRFVYEAAVEALAARNAEGPAGEADAVRALAIVDRAKARDLLDSLGPAARAALASPGSEIGRRVGDDVLIEFFVTAREVYRFTVDRGALRFERVAPTPALRERVLAIHGALSTGAPPADGLVEDVSGLLLAGIAGAIDGRRHVWVAPDRFLHYLPFEILRAPGAERLLVESATVGYLPSGAMLGRLGREKRDGPALLAVGDPILPDPGAGPTPASLWVDRFGVQPLPAARQELLELARLLPGDTVALTREEATEEAFGDHATAGPRVVHVASHTVVDERRGGGAAILLSPGPGPGSDGLLHPAEIAALDYPVGLTVLAACRTALGSSEDGSALGSLTGSFLAAGSSAVLATLWEVDDAATRAFMEQFYHHLRRGVPASEALRRAKLRMLRDPRWRGSQHWSPYVLFGSAPPLEPGRGRTVPALGAAAVVALLVAAWIRRRRQGARSN